jgi:O-antigen ligase
MAGTPAISDVRLPPFGLRAVGVATGCTVAVAGLAAYDLATAGVVALFAAGFLLASIHPGLVAPCLALALPAGHWHPHVIGSQAPALEAASIGVALGCLPRLLAALRSSQYRPGVADAAFAVFFAGVIVSGFGPAPKSEWAHNVVLWGALMIAFSASSRVMHSALWRKIFLGGIAVTGAAEAVVTIVQYAQGASERFSRLGGAIVYPQPVGTLQNPNTAAPFLAVCLLLLVGRALAEPRVQRAVLVAIAVLVGVASLLPYSRGGWISLTAGLLAWSAVQRRSRYLITTVVVLGGLLVAAIAFGGTFGSRITSLASRHFSDLYGFRATLADRAIHLIVHHPLTGTGVFHEIGTYAGRPSLATHPHDLLLGVAVFFGIPAALGFLGVLIFAFRGSIRASLAGLGTRRAEGAGAFAALVALVVNGFLEYQFWNQAFAVLTVLTFAYAVALGEPTSRPTAADERFGAASVPGPTMGAAMPPEVP